MNSNHTERLQDFVPANEAEFHTLEQLWQNGELEVHRQWVLQFADGHRAEIVQRAAGSSEPGALLTACKLLIVERAVNHQAEMAAQLKTIHDHLWISAEQGRNPRDREQVVEEWIAQHAGPWRRWRNVVYLFIVEKCSTELVGRVLKRGQPVVGYTDPHDGSNS